MTALSRRKLIQSGSALGAANILWNPMLRADEDKPNPRSNKFLLNIHFGSSCGIANGLIQAEAPGKWPAGYFGKEGLPANPLLNQHTQAGSLVFHDYNKFLASMANDMCLVNGTPISLDHNVARNIQLRGSPVESSSPEWAMGVTEFMRTDKDKNPMVLSSGARSSSVANITNVKAATIENFRTVTQDIDNLRKDPALPIWAILRDRYKGATSDSVKIDAAFGQNADNQLDLLFKGLPALKAAQATIDSVTAALSGEKTAAILKTTTDNDGVDASKKIYYGFSDGMKAGTKFQQQLMLAGVLAKTGLAHGMTVYAFEHDAHRGGADVQTARAAAGYWAIISQLWGWIRAEGLQDDVMIVVTQEFARGPYNPFATVHQIVNEKGENPLIKAYGRDHGVAMGTMFINAKVPKAGRVGVISENLIPVGSKDAAGTIDPGSAPYTSSNIVGSMLLRVFDDLFPTERLVRKHWPTFKEIPQILS